MALNSIKSRLNKKLLWINSVVFQVVRIVGRVLYQVNTIKDNHYYFQVLFYPCFNAAMQQFSMKSITCRNYFSFGFELKKMWKNMKYTDLRDFIFSTKTKIAFVWFCYKKREQFDRRALLQDGWTIPWKSV